MAYVSTQGTLLKIDISGTLTTIPQVFSCTPPGVTLQEKDVTHFGSTGQEKVALISQFSNATAQMYFDPANSVHDLLMDQSLLTTKAEDSFTITFADAGAALLAFDGYIGLELNAAQNDVLTATLTITTSAAPVYTQ